MYKAIQLSDYYDTKKLFAECKEAVSRELQKLLFSNYGIKEYSLNKICKTEKNIKESILMSPLSSSTHDKHSIFLALFLPRSFLKG